ncbi:MAG: winged helix-turn-helix domain-containing protein [Dehalococcoidia bacterium]|nr:winged helix-turn-helix domain-containing protein [Dehalococcoidia bacterium]
MAERLGILGVEAIPSAREWKLAVRCLTSHKVSLILLDVGDDAGSREFFELVREVTDIPIVARGSVALAEQAVWYLNNGAVDYVSRTIPSAVLVAKISSFLQAVTAGANTGYIRLGDLAIDLDHYSVTRSGQGVALTPIEFRLLRVLAENAGKACSHQVLLDRVWGSEFRDCSHYLRLYMGYLRQKLEDDPKRPKILLTEWGYGYRLVDAQKQDARALRRVSFRSATG